jgi:hypothetical protein
MKNNDHMHSDHMHSDHMRRLLATPMQSNDAIRERLPEYATQTALGQAPEETYPQVAAHLNVCETCRAEFAELLNLTTDMYSGQVAVADSYPPCDLAFLRQPTMASPQHPPWLIDELGRVVIVFSQQLLEALRQPGMAGALRGQLLYRYMPEVGSLPDLDVTIAAFVEEAATGAGRVRVDVEVPSRGPFDQSGNQVVLHADDSIWQDETDEVGSVDFAPFPLEALPRLRVQITPLRQTHG